MKVKVGIILALIALFLNVGVCSAFEKIVICEDSSLLNKKESDSTEMVKERAYKVYCEGYNTYSCREVRIFLIADAIRLFMENPYLSPHDVSYIKSIAILLEDFCEMGKYDKKFGRDNFIGSLELLKKEIEVYRNF